MNTSVVEQAMVYAVMDGTVRSDRDGIIDAVCLNRAVAESVLCEKARVQETYDSRIWRVLEYPVTSLISVPVDLRMLFVVYECDDDGVRPVYLTHRERLAQLKVRELDIDAQIRLLTDELTGQTGTRPQYWWECCPVLF